MEKEDKKKKKGRRGRNKDEEEKKGDKTGHSRGVGVRAGWSAAFIPAQSLWV